MNRGPVAEIDLSALQNNLAVVRKIVRKRAVIAVVKADAYGHGAAAVSRALTAEGITHLAVAFTGEARVLRASGITVPIIVLFDRSDIHDYFDLSLTPVVSDRRAAAAFSSEAARRSTVMSVHLKIDTGMGRLGVQAGAAASEAVAIAGMEGIKLAGLMSHFSEADLADRSYALEQIKAFEEIRKTVVTRLGHPVLCHMANSAAALSLHDALFDAVRPGILLYGCSPFEEDFGLKPVMKVKTHILALRRLSKGQPVSYGRTFVTRRESLIGVIPAGYADGFNRLFSNNAEVLVRGRRAPVAGRVCMDLTMIDVTGIQDVSEGDEVVLLGGQAGETITAREMASRINTIPYEIITSLGSRARREYIS
ncbi:MAG: alanine racemase [Nitrospiraceae bacterium]|nr:alanine racemase [Nitrospiraceae bacterium]